MLFVSFTSGAPLQGTLGIRSSLAAHPLKPDKPTQPALRSPSPQKSPWHRVSVFAITVSYLLYTSWPLGEATCLYHRSLAKLVPYNPRTTFTPTHPKQQRQCDKAVAIQPPCHATGIWSKIEPVTHVKGAIVSPRAAQHGPELIASR
ncbi:hypothetical protein BS50DRAFT_109990 [Corynespora cassiicola Philippines]|uniref:Uncharacterized protein n=1 Tax=Corynespora cassiicola Philippines TaxID=1448308 RepID=A0A2T2ND28_CORCC|nr:hypothetical protein BS50DRAFT_109990 [Corynespora cassiicola Philippines]